VTILADGIPAFLLVRPTLSSGGFGFAQTRLLPDDEFFDGAIAQINGLTRRLARSRQRQSSPA
jgi:hypothetical protein